MRQPGAASARVRATGVALVIVLASAAALAGDPVPPPNARADRAAAGWAKLGGRALPAVLRAYCGHDRPLQRAAMQELRRQGLPAVEALLRQTGESCDGSALAGEVLCQVSPLDDAALRATLVRLTPLVAAPYKAGAGAGAAVVDAGVDVPADSALRARRARARTAIASRRRAWTCCSRRTSSPVSRPRTASRSR